MQGVAWQLRDCGGGTVKVSIPHEKSESNARAVMLIGSVLQHIRVFTERWSPTQR
jgi:hypothetical protein